MKNYKKLLIAMVLLISCNAIPNYTINSLVYYDGKISLSNGVNTSTSNGNSKYAELEILNNSFVLNGWVPKNSIANNSAILFYDENKLKLDNIDEIKIVIDNNEYSYSKKSLDSMVIERKSCEDVANKFTKLLYDNNLVECKQIFDIKNRTSITDTTLTNLFETFKPFLKKTFLEVGLIGFDKNLNIFKTNFCILDKSNSTKLFELVINKIGNEYKIKEVAF